MEGLSSAKFRTSSSTSMRDLSTREPGRLRIGVLREPGRVGVEGAVDSGGGLHDYLADGASGLARCRQDVHGADHVYLVKGAAGRLG